MEYSVRSTPYSLLNISFCMGKSPRGVTLRRDMHCHAGLARVDGATPGSGMAEAAKLNQKTPQPTLNRVVYLKQTRLSSFRRSGLFLSARSGSSMYCESSISVNRPSAASGIPVDLIFISHPVATGDLYTMHPKNVYYARLVVPYIQPGIMQSTTHYFMFCSR